MQNPKKLAVSISIGILILIGVFAVIVLTPSGLFTGAMRNLKKDGAKTEKSAAWWCITEREAQKKWKDYWCNQSPLPEWAKEMCKDYKKGSSTPGGQTLSPETIKFFQSGQFPVPEGMEKAFKIWNQQNSGNGMVAGNIPQPETQQPNPTPPEDDNKGSADSSTETTPPTVHEKQPEYSDEQYCKDLAAGNVSSGCDCGQKTKFDTKCHKTVTCDYWPPDSVCDPKWRCPTGYVQDEAGVDEKCMDEILNVKQLQCAGKTASLNPDIKKACEAFDDDYMFGLLDQPCVEKDKCKHLKQLFDEGISTNEALGQLGMSTAEYGACEAMFNAEWSGKKPW